MRRKKFCIENMQGFMQWRANGINGAG